MKAEELMKPRFEVIADYPNNKLVIGSVIESDSDQMFKIQEGYFLGLKRIEQYPHLFRKLNWWEKRSIEDMPKRLVCKAIPNDTEIMDIQEWDMDLMVGWLNKKERTCCSLLSFNPEYGYYPVD